MESAWNPNFRSGSIFRRTWPALGETRINRPHFHNRGGVGSNGTFLIRYDPDSGHDSGAEDNLDSAPPFCFLTMGMGKIYLPQHSYSHHGNGPRDNGPSSPTGLTYPLPPRLGVCLDFEKGRVTFYDAHSLRPLWEGHVDCSGPVCPAFCFIGGGALQLQELVANRNADQTPVRRVTIQTRVSNVNNN